MSLSINSNELFKERYTTGEVARLVNVTTRTIAHHQEKGFINMVQDENTRRWYASKQDVIQYLKSQGYSIIEDKITRKNVIYARVSSNEQKQKGDLDRQVGYILSKISSYNLDNIDVITDVGSGLNTNKKGIQKLIKMVIDGDVETVYISNKDRLTRFGYEYLEVFFKSYNTNIIYLNEKIDKNTNQELVDDMISLIASFSGRYYGMRSAEKKKLKDKVTEVLKD